MFSIKSVLKPILMGVLAISISSCLNDLEEQPSPQTQNDAISAPIGDAEVNIGDNPAVGDRQTTCNCFYQVTKVMGPQGQNVEESLLLNSTAFEFCTAVGTDGVSLMSGIYLEDGCTPNFNTQYIPTWTSLPPAGLIPFNCAAMPFIDFNVFLNAIFNCPLSTAVTVQFRVGCQDPCATLTPGNKKLIYSGIKSLTISPTQSQSVVPMSLGGTCGCTPL
ncbi:MAG: hypothetical protein MUC59_02215 [Saprospiraceae bacterium]|jgi:hypothetical protein|nr:hypothetical protein [Saprospiraceae bacterium]